MKNVPRVIFCLVILCVVYSYAPAQNDRSKIEILVPKGYQPLTLVESAELEAILNKAVGAILDPAYAKGFKREEIAATLIDLRDPNALSRADFRGEERLYPASVVKMFYMAALHQQFQDEKIALTKELERGLRDMIFDSSNEATQYILDVLTDTSSGGELPQKQFDQWQYKRNRVNRFFSSMGYKNININQKTHCEDAYGVEQQSREYKGRNRNMLTTNATARLLAEIALRRFVNMERSNMMLDLMKRDPFTPSADPDNQAVGFIGKALIDGKMTGAKLWSKAGWVSRERHDAAYIETPDGLKFVLVIFTENHSNEREPIPLIAGKVIDGMRIK
ncbi:MAG: serine hydrolase [Blastocatellia bacterium]